MDTNNLWRLDDDANVGEAVRYLIMALRRWGVTRTLDFQRGGAPFNCQPIRLRGVRISKYKLL